MWICFIVCFSVKAFSVVGISPHNKSSREGWHPSHKLGYDFGVSQMFYWRIKYVVLLQTVTLKAHRTRHTSRSVAEITRWPWKDDWTHKTHEQHEDIVTNVWWLFLWECDWWTYRGRISVDSQCRFDTVCKCGLWNWCFLVLFVM